MPAIAISSKIDALAALEQMQNDCRRRAGGEGRTHYVFGRGNADARLMLIGEAPGATEDRRGLPFVGRAGQLLDALLAEAGIDAENVYITNVVKFRPMRSSREPGRPRNDRPPNKAEITACLPILQRQIEIINPQVICTLGNTPLRTLLNVASGIGRMHGKSVAYRDIPVLPTYHPAAVFHNPSLRALLSEDLRKVQRILMNGRTGR